MIRHDSKPHKMMEDRKDFQIGFLLHIREAINTPKFRMLGERLLTRVVHASQKLCVSYERDSIRKVNF